jgi:hypothetical protein
MAVDLVGRHGGSRNYIQGSTCNHGNEGKTNNLGWMLYSVCAVLSDVNRPVRRPGTVGRPNSCQDGRDGAGTVRPVQACQ